MSNFIDLLPHNLQSDETIKQFAEVLENEIVTLDNIISQLTIYANIDTLNEAYIDAMADAFHITHNEGYQFADTLDKKRSLVKNAISLHKHKGTLYSIRQVLDTLDLKGNILEWFEYDGEPYHFKLDIDLSDGVSFETVNKLIALINEFKNARSHLERILFNIVSNGNVYFCATATMGHVIEVEPYITDNIIANTILHNSATTQVVNKITI